MAAKVNAKQLDVGTVKDKRQEDERAQLLVSEHATTGTFKHAAERAEERPIRCAIRALTLQCCSSSKTATELHGGQDHY